MIRTLAVVSFFALLQVGAALADTEITTSQRQPSLAGALEALRADGLDLIYSEALVRGWMTVRPNTPTGPPEERLAALLKPYDLVAIRGGNSMWLVTRVPTPEASAGSLFGRVVNGNGGHPVMGVTVALDGTNRVTRTDSGGRFTIDGIGPGSYQLSAASYGYIQVVPVTVDIVAGQSRWQEIPVDDAPLTLDQVAVVASQYRLLSSQAGNNVFLNREEVDRLPHLGDDLHRAIKLLPGTAGNDFTGRTNLRGGVADETSVRLDGLELIDPFHLKDLGGGLGTVDSELIKGVDLISGGFGAELGNTSSGFIDAQTISPTGEAETSVGVSFINAFARNQGGFENGNGGWLVSLRRGYLDLLLDRVETDADDIRPRYWDFLSKVDYRLSDRLSLMANVFATRDDTTVINSGGDGVDLDEAKLKADSQYLWVTAAMDPDDRVHGELTLSTGLVTEDRDVLTGDVFGDAATLEDDLRVRFNGVRTDWTWLASPSHLFRLGSEARHLDATYDYDLVGRDFNIFSPDRLLIFDRHVHDSVEGDEYSAWGAWRFQPVEPLTAELGLRWDKQTYTDLGDDDQVSPRINLAWQFEDDTRLRAAWGYFHQAQRINEMKVEDGEDFFHPAQRAEHRVIGIDHVFDNGLSMRLDLYQKKYTDVIPRYENLFDPLEVPGEAQADRVRIAPDRTEAHGVEFSLKGQWGERIDWWGSYTFSEVEDHIDGQDIPRSWDQRHATTVGANWRGRKWDFSFVHTFHSGWPRTDASFDTITDDDGNDVIVVVPGPRNNENFDNYHRLDMRASRRVTLPRGILRYYFEVYNMYDRKNQCCTQGFEVVGDGMGGAELRQETAAWLPLIPSFGVSYTFK